MDLSPATITLLIAVGGTFLAIVVIFSMLSRFLVKAEPGKALVKTGFGSPKPSINLSSAVVVPLLHRVDTIDLTVKTVRIARRKQESLSCADGIRAEVEVDFYIKINPLEEDIRHVASTIGCNRASDTEILRELFEAKFADALKTAGAKLQFDQLYKNRREFRDEILKALGQEGDQDVVLNGYKLDDVAIQFLEQLPLEAHNEDNVLDARGRKEIAERTSAEVEAANKRLRQKEVTIAEQDRGARLRQLEIAQDIAEKEAAQSREISEAQAREHAATEKTVAEQEKLAEEARIEKDRQIRVAEQLRDESVQAAEIEKERKVRLAQEQKEQEVRAAEIARERAIQLADEQKQQEIENAKIMRERAVKVAEQEKIKQVEIARIEREAAEAEALKVKLKMLEETALQEAEKIKAEEQAQTVRALEIAHRQKQIETIEAEKEAAVEKEMRQVEADVKSYEITKVAQANLEAADLNAQAAEKQAHAIEEVGRAEAAAKQLKLEAENVINERVILAQALQQLIPLLPELTEKLMLPAEKIDSIKILNVGGLDRMGGGLPTNGTSHSGSNIGGSLINTVVNAGMFLPVIKEVLRTLQGNDEYSDIVHTLRKLPGGEALIRSLRDDPPTLGDGAPTTEA